MGAEHSSRPPAPMTGATTGPPGALVGFVNRG